MNNKQVVRTGINNILFTFSSQGISLLLSIIMTLIIPKVLGVNEFGYWQLYLFYTGYVGFFHFGVIDGINLRYGGLNYKSIDKAVLRSQLILLVMSQIIFTVAVISLGFIFTNDAKRVFIITFTGMCLIITNLETFFWYILQATNRIISFSISIISEKIVMLIITIVLIFFHIDRFELYIYANLLSKLIGLVIGANFCKELIIGKLNKFYTAIEELKENIVSGSKLMFSNISSMLILGNGRFFIDRVWGIEVFGKISFSFTLSNMILLFINSISIVLFPTLRRVSRDKLTEIYGVLRTGLMTLLTGALIIYIPAKSVIAIWLPQYFESIKYMAIIFPLIIFDGKMQMLISTNFKVIRKEGVLLRSNIISLIVSFVLCSISAYVFNSLNAVVVSMVIVVIFRSIIAELYLSKELNISITRGLFGEVAIVVSFMLSTWYLDGLVSLFIYLTVYIAYLGFNSAEIKKTIKVIRRAFA